MDGELSVARAARARGTLQCLSTMTSTPIEEVNKALGRPVWYQLYAPSKWEVCEQLLKRVEAAGSTVVLLTVDNTTGRNSETYKRMRPKDLQPCMSCHPGPGEPPGPTGERAMFKGIDMKGVREFEHLVRDCGLGALRVARAHGRRVRSEHVRNAVSIVTHEIALA